MDMYRVTERAMAEGRHDEAKMEEPTFKTPFLTCQRCNALNVIDGDDLSTMPVCCCCGRSLHLVLGVRDVQADVVVQAEELGLAAQFRNACAVLVQTHIRSFLAKITVRQRRWVRLPAVPAQFGECDQRLQRNCAWRAGRPSSNGDSSRSRWLCAFRK